MAKLLVCVPTHDMLLQAESVVAARGIDATVRLTSSAHVLDIARAERQNGALVAIARGSQAEALRQNMDIPLVEIVLSGQNLAVLFKEARRISGKERPKVALIGFHNMFSETDTLADIIGIDLMVGYVSYSREIPEAVEKACADGAEVIIGGEIAMEAAARLHVAGVFLSSTRDTIDTAITAAKHILYAIEIEKRRAEEFSAYLDYSMDVVLQLEANGHIRYANYMAEKQFSLSVKALQSKNIADLLDLAAAEHPINAAMRDKKNVYGCTVRTDSVAFMANLAVINADTEYISYLLTMQDFKRIEKMEETVRRSNFMSAAYKAIAIFDDIKTLAPAMTEARELAMRYARYDLPVLIEGEHGVGKRLFAECIHNFSLRNDRSFVTVNCGALSPEMQQKALLGRDERTDGRGAVTLAYTGTLLIENVDQLCPTCQYQLLMLLESHCVPAPDGHAMLPMDVRLICTSVRNLSDCVREGKFLETLYSRLSQLKLRVPSLTECPDDLPGLLDRFLEEFSAKYHKYVAPDNEARRLIYSFYWQGNIEQLRLFCEKLVIMADNKVINADFVRLQLPDTGSARAENAGEKEKPVVVVSVSEAADIIAALRRFSGNRQAAAETLGMSKTTLWRKMKKYGIDDSSVI